MEKPIAATHGPFRPVLDGRIFTRHPFDPDAPPLSAGIPFMAGNVATETRIMIASRGPGHFVVGHGRGTAQAGRYLRIDATETYRILDAYRTADPRASPGDPLALVTTDYNFVRNTRREATLQSASAPTYSYIFTRRRPVMNGLLRAPHESQVAFVFGTTDAAAHIVGTGADIVPLTQIMLSTWSAFARNGNSNNPTLPRWLRHNAKDEFSMMLNVSSRIERDPGGQARASLDHLPFFEYNMPNDYTRA